MFIDLFLGFPHEFFELRFPDGKMMKTRVPEKVRTWQGDAHTDALVVCVNKIRCGGLTDSSAEPFSNFWKRTVWVSLQPVRSIAR